jgi:ATP-dependent RNA helicase DOB1
MSRVEAWATGARFADVLKMSGGNVYEGSVVRSIRRLEELLRQVAAALQSIGNQELAGRFEDAITRIKRDVIFAASLYL